MFPCKLTCQCFSSSSVLGVKNLARMEKVVEKRRPDESSTMHGFSTPPTLNSSTFSDMNFAISSFRKWARMKSGNSTVRKSWNCQHTTWGTETASFLQALHGRSASHCPLVSFPTLLDRPTVGQAHGCSIP